MNRYQMKLELIKVIAKNLENSLSKLSDDEFNKLVVDECNTCIERAAHRANKWKDSGDSGACFDHEGGFIARKLLEELEK